MKKKNILITLFALILLLSVVAVTYAYYIGGANNDKAQTANLSTGTMSLTFADNDNGFGGTIEFGQTITKKFTIQNTGTLDASAQINWSNLVNTYSYGSLVYTLEYSETENGTYTKVIEDRNVPQSGISTTELLAPKITVPTNKKYFYNLKITLIDSFLFDQTSDLSASFYTQFDLVGLDNILSSEDTLAALNLTKREGTPKFTQRAPANLNTDTNFKGTEFSLYDDYGDDIYNLNFVYGDSYEFNIYNGTFSILNAKVGKFSDIYNELSGKYIGYAEVIQANGHVIANTENIEPTAFYKVISATATDAIVKYGSISKSTQQENYEAGIYAMEDDYGTSYYFRGSVDNNYVKFGKWGTWYKGFQNATTTTSFEYYSSLEECQNATSYNVNCTSMENEDMYWRIMRINGDGSLRLVYDGTTAHSDDDTSKDRYLSATKYSILGTNNDNASLGYMYGELSADSYQKTHQNINNSNIKNFLDSWYEENIEAKGFDKYVSDEIFCNDRSLQKGRTDSTQAFGTKSNLYSAIDRFDNYYLYSSISPQLVCPQKNDAFTVNDTIKGNGALSKPVGLLTADEAAIAGCSAMNQSFAPVSKNYLYKGATYYWTMTPSINTGSTSSSMYGVYNGRLVTNMSTNFDRSVVPVINLSPKTAKELIGTGTASDPFRLS